MLSQATHVQTTSCYSSCWFRDQRCCVCGSWWIYDIVECPHTHSKWTNGPMVNVVKFKHIYLCLNNTTMTLHKILCLWPPQNAIVSFKELCGLSAVANLKQCILALSSRLTGPDNAPVLLFNLKDQYSSMEPQGVLPEVLKKVVMAYDTVRSLSS